MISDPAAKVVSAADAGRGRAAIDPIARTTKKARDRAALEAAAV
jgi:hypothetical protein